MNLAPRDPFRELEDMNQRLDRTLGRSFGLPDIVGEGNVKAEFNDGLLTLRLPKTAKAKPRAVEVKVD